MSSAARKWQRSKKGTTRPCTEAEIHALVREIYSAHFILWHAGYTPDEIFVQAARVANMEPCGWRMVVHLRYVGQETNLFTLVVSPVIAEADSERICAAWLAFIRDGKTAMTKEALDEYVEGSFLRREYAAILGLLAMKKLLLIENDTTYVGEMN